MSTLAVPVHVALVSETETVGISELMKLTGALNRQVQEDFAPVWKVSATVGAYLDPPPQAWTIFIQATLDEPGALGYHTDDHNQPVAFVDDEDDWRMTVSHELLEMLADPWGNRLHGARLPSGLENSFDKFGLKHRSSHVHYLVEVCDPPERFGYDVGGITLSDFILPRWYRTNLQADQQTSLLGACRKPHEVADGGYVSFMVDGGDWFQVFNSGGLLRVNDIGRFDRKEFGSLRAFTDHNARLARRVFE